MKLSILSQILLIRFWANKGKFSPVFFSISVQYFSTLSRRISMELLIIFHRKQVADLFTTCFYSGQKSGGVFRQGAELPSVRKNGQTMEFPSGKSEIIFCHCPQLVKTFRHLSRQTICVSFRLLSGSSIRKRHQARTTILPPPPPLEYSSCKSKAGPAAACV